MFIFISESELTLFQVGSLKNPTFQVCDYTINILNVEIEQHMAKEIKGINQLNGMTQTDMIRQICILQRGVQGHGKRTSPKENTESQTSKNNCCGWKSWTPAGVRCVRCSKLPRKAEVIYFRMSPFSLMLDFTNTYLRDAELITSSPM